MLRELLDALKKVFRGGYQKAPNEQTVAEIESGKESCLTGDYTTAISHFTTVISRNPNLADAYCGRGIASVLIKAVFGKCKL